MKVVDVMASGQLRERASVLQSKTRKPVRFEISQDTRALLARWMQDPLMIGFEYLWQGRFHERLHISTHQYARIVRDWVTSIGLEATAYCTHSMRRTKVTQGGRNNAVFMIRLLHLMLFCGERNRAQNFASKQGGTILPWFSELANPVLPLGKMLSELVETS